MLTPDEAKKRRVRVAEIFSLISEANQLLVKVSAAANANRSEEMFSLSMSLLEEADTKLNAYKKEFPNCLSLKYNRWMQVGVNSGGRVNVGQGLPQPPLLTEDNQLSPEWVTWYSQVMGYSHSHALEVGELLLNAYQNLPPSEA